MQSISTWLSRLLLLGAAALLAACSSTPSQKSETLEETPAQRAASAPINPSGTMRLSLTTFEAIPATQDEDWSNALGALQASCATAMGNRAPWKEACREANQTTREDARDFFTHAFTVWRVSVMSEDGAIKDTGLMTGYYEPLLRGSRTRGGQYQTPLYGVPRDMIVVGAKGKPQGQRLKMQGGKRVPYDTRAQITQRKNFPARVICWVDDPVEAFFLQVQGSGRVEFPDGRMIRVAYAEHNGQPYKSLGNWLIRNAGMSASSMSMQAIQNWARQNPKRVQALLNTNPRYVFFSEAPIVSPEAGPKGAQGVPLTAKGSVAVDRREWPLGMPLVVQAEQSLPQLSFTRPVVAQDTGTAIKGVLRFDFFWGYGDEAGQDAGRQKSSARAWVLIPRGQDPETFF